MDKLDIIYNEQYKFQKNFGILKKINKSSAMKQQYINQMILALHEEAVEIMRESPYKNPNYVPFGWKKEQKFNIEKFKEEIIDIIHFVINLCIVVDMKPQEIYDKYLNKNKENHQRQKDNY